MTASTLIGVFAGIVLCVSSQALEEPNQIKIKAGSGVTIPLNVTLDEGEIFLSLSWKYENIDIAGWAGEKEFYTDAYSKKATIIKDNYSLALVSTTLADTGEYRGTLLTSKGSIEQRTFLSVLASPTVTAKSVQVLDDQTGDKKVVAECKAIGGSAPYTIEWYQGDKLVAGDDEKIRENNSENPTLEGALLALTLVPKAKDNGNTVRCVVTDALQEQIVEEVQLQITEPTTTVPTTTMQAYPEITRFTRLNQPFVIGSDRRLNCQAAGVPEPTVTWYKDDKKLASGTGESKIVVVAKSYADSGVYKCEAKNREGLVTKTLTIEVQGAPIIHKNPTNKTEEVFVEWNEENVELTCQSQSVPSPGITWQVEGMELKELEHKIKERNTTQGGIESNITIKSTHFHGGKSQNKITCTAKNDIGKAKKDFIITIGIPATNAGMIAGVVVALIILILIIALIVCIAMSRKRQGSMKTSASPESGVCPSWSTCCGSPVVKSKELKEEEDAIAVEHVKEVSEDGTNEEKQKLTEAEETPAKEDSTTEAKDEEKSEEKEEGEVAKPKKSNRVPLPMQCCRGKKEKSTGKGEPQEGQVEEEKQEKGTGNGDTKKEEQVDEEKKEKQQTDRDSGKGDTLEKVIEVEEK